MIYSYAAYLGGVLFRLEIQVILGCLLDIIVYVYWYILLKLWMDLEVKLVLFNAAFYCEIRTCSKNEVLYEMLWKVLFEMLCGYCRWVLDVFLLIFNEKLMWVWDSGVWYFWVGLRVIVESLWNGCGVIVEWLVIF